MKSLFRTRPAIDAAEHGELRAMLAAVDRSQAVIEFELDGAIRTANANFLSVVGYALDEVRGRHHSLFMDPAEAASPEYKAFWRRLNAGEFFAD
ncbi:MAG: PAS domain S-box protein, partial [Brevundimonas sp.]